MTIRVLYPEIGAQVAGTHQLAYLPEGARMSSDNREWVKRADGRFDRIRTDGRQDTVGYSPSDFVMMGTRVTSYPDGFERPEAPQVTVEAFRQEVATTVVGAARAAGVTIDPVFTALEHLSIPAIPEEVGAGMVLDIYDRDIRALNCFDRPLLFTAGDPRNYDQSWTGTITRDGTFNALLGRARIGYLFRSGVVVEQPDMPRWAPAFDHGTAEDAQAIALLKSEAWKIGIKAKQHNSWCGEYEAAMLRLGITAESVIAEPGDVGQIAVREEVRNLPLGTVVYYRNTEPDRWYFFIRSEDSTNNHGLRRLIAGQRNATAHYASAAEYRVVAQPGRRIPMTENHWLMHLPVGSWLSDTQGSSGFEKIGPTTFRHGVLVTRATPQSAATFRPNDNGMVHEYAAFRESYLVARVGADGEWLR